MARWRHSFRRDKQIGNALDSIAGYLECRILLLTHAVLLGLVREQHELPVEEQGRDFQFGSFGFGHWVVQKRPTVSAIAGCSLVRRASPWGQENAGL
jgi:hypothetical protein